MQRSLTNVTQRRHFAQAAIAAVYIDSVKQERRLSNDSVRFRFQIYENLKI